MGCLPFLAPSVYIPQMLECSRGVRRWRTKLCPWRAMIMGAPDGSGLSGGSVFTRFFCTFEAGELEDCTCVHEASVPCMQNEACLYCAALRDGKDLLGKRRAGKNKLAEGVKALLDDPQFKVGWGATDTRKWPSDVVWAINASKTFRKELSHLGAIEMDKAMIKRGSQA